MTANRSIDIGAIVLAAGGSRRLGKPKQFLEYDGKTLLRRTAEAVVESQCEPVIIVAGNDIEKVIAEVDGLEVVVCPNPDWASGMSSSIKAGLARLLEIQLTINAVMISLCDQPFADLGSFERLISAFDSAEKEMAGSEYNGIVGVPAIFSKAMFDELQKLEGDRGARDLLRAPGASIVAVKAEEAAADIDTNEDVEGLRAINRR